MERLVLVHGSVRNGEASWVAQNELADDFELVVLNRPGFPPNPIEEHIARNMADGSPNGSGGAITYALTGRHVDLPDPLPPRSRREIRAGLTARPTSRSSDGR